MRVINLDETGIKLITSNKKQMYISLKKIKDFLDRKYTLTNNRLAFNNNELVLTDSEVEEFDSTYNYIQGIYEKGK